MFPIYLYTLFLYFMELFIDILLLSRLKEVKHNIKGPIYWWLLFFFLPYNPFTICNKPMKTWFTVVVTKRLKFIKDGCCAVIIYIYFFKLAGTNHNYRKIYFSTVLLRSSLMSRDQVQLSHVEMRKFGNSNLKILWMIIISFVI